MVLYRRTKSLAGWLKYHLEFLFRCFIRKKLNFSLVIYSGGGNLALFVSKEHQSTMLDRFHIDCKCDVTTAIADLFDSCALLLQELTPVNP